MWLTFSGATIEAVEDTAVMYTLPQPMAESRRWSVCFYLLQYYNSMLQKEINLKKSDALNHRAIMDFSSVTYTYLMLKVCTNDRIVGVWL